MGELRTQDKKHDLSELIVEAASLHIIQFRDGTKHLELCQLAKNIANENIFTSDELKGRLNSVPKVIHFEDIQKMLSEFGMVTDFPPEKISKYLNKLTFSRYSK